MVLAGALSVSCALHAQTPADPVADLDALALASSEAGSGIAMARAQIGDGDLLGAAATLERILLAYPEEERALLLHAGLLCRLDDPEGARLELAPLRGRAISAEAWAEATAGCDPTISGSAG
jgi:hypothetical protein